MKLSLLFPAILLAAACGSTENGPPAPPGPPPPASTDNPPPPPPPPPGGPARTLVDKPIMPTSPDNLVNDPEFEGLWKPLDQTGFGIYESYVESGKAEVRFAPTTPVGPGFAVVKVTAGSVLLNVTGGHGPFEASVWVAAQKPDDVTLELASYIDDTTVTLQPVTADARDVGGVHWVPYRARAEQDLGGAVALVVTVPTAAVDLVAPEVLAPAPQHAPRPFALVPAQHLSASTRAKLEAFGAWRAAHTTTRRPPRPKVPREVLTRGLR
jgi:hypothetical protein